MRTLGLIGGMSWESTALSYQWINRGVRDRRGPLCSAHLLIDSLNFADIVALQRAGDWTRAGEAMASSARRLQRAGAHGLLIATNTMHKVAAAVTDAVPLPFLHIADSTGHAIRAAGLDTVALLGTAFTMEDGFYQRYLREKFDIHCLVPEAEQRREVHRVIFDELCAGIRCQTSRAMFCEAIAQLARQGAQAAILGCTEIALLVEQSDSPIPVFDTTALHAAAAVEFCLASNEGKSCAHPASPASPPA
ncbi:MAG: aspartate/glutamate racemase family protein [Rhodanobacter sp.]|jgi:aspartate racemase|nr:aspartate/glutamate racemase family protein [Rhodanobacter sp.]